MKAQAAAKPAQADGPASGVPASGEFPVAEDTPKCARVQLEKIADGQLTSAERSTAMSDALSAFCLATPRPAVPYESGAPIEVKRNNASSVVVRWRIVNLLN
jgi:hypothetical protein